MIPDVPDHSRQHTVAGPVTVDGVGVHSGREVRVCLRPAPVDTGVVFRRVDLPGEPSIPAAPEAMVSGPRCTTLSAEGASVRTIEHLMAVLLAFGIDNAVVEMDAEEAPILDGSADGWVAAIASVGTVAQDAPSHPVTLAAPVVWASGDTTLIALPNDSLRVSVASVTTHPIAGTQAVDLTVDRESFRRALAPARTFCYREEVEALLAAGLARGGSLDNALVVGQDGYSSSLRVDQELAAHKALDLLGDLAVLGRSLRFHVVAVRPGHRANQELVRCIRAAQRQWESDPGRPAPGAAREPEGSVALGSTAPAP